MSERIKIRIRIRIRVRVGIERSSASNDRRLEGSKPRTFEISIRILAEAFGNRRFKFYLGEMESQFHLRSVARLAAFGLPQFDVRLFCVSIASICIGDSRAKITYQVAAIKAAINHIYQFNHNLTYPIRSCSILFDPIRFHPSRAEAQSHSTDPPRPTRFGSIPVRRVAA